MSTTKILIAVGAVAAVAGIGYLILSKPAPAAQNPLAGRPPAGPSGYAQGGNGTLNTVSQGLGVAAQAESIFGKGLDIYNSQN